MSGNNLTKRPNAPKTPNGNSAKNNKSNNSNTKAPSTTTTTTAPSKLSVEEQRLELRTSSPVVKFMVEIATPIRLWLDCVLAATNPQFIRHFMPYYTNWFNIGQACMAVTWDPQHVVYNRDIRYTTFLTLLPFLYDIFETYFLLKYRAIYSKQYALLLVHHFALLAVSSSILLLCDNGALCLTAFVALTHLFMAPTATFREWRHWKDEWRVVALALFCGLGLGNMAFWFFGSLFILIPAPNSILTQEKLETMGVLRYILIVVFPLLFLHFYIVLASQNKVLRNRGLLPSWMALPNIF